MTNANGSSSHRKLALVIGNGKYKRRGNHLKHSVKTARKLSNLLETINFNVTTYVNIDKDMMKNISDFANTIVDGDLVLFYYAGHSRQVDGENYLIPTDDDRIVKDIDVKDIGIRATKVLNRLTKQNESYITIFILDCYKQYFLKNESLSAVQEKGLKEMHSSSPTFIQFACAANQTTSNRRGENYDNLFAEHLLRNITQEDTCITDIFQQIVNGVLKESNNKQQPLSMNELQQHHQVCLYEVPDDVKIKECNHIIGELQVELDNLTLKEPPNGGLYDPITSCSINEMKAAIHKLTLRRNRAIYRRFTALSIK